MHNGYLDPGLFSAAQRTYPVISLNLPEGFAALDPEYVNWIGSV